MSIKAKFALSVAGLAVVALATGAGYLWGVKDTNQAQYEKFMDAAAQSTQAANRQAVESAQSSAEVDSKQAASAQSINTISDEVSKRLEKQEPQIIYRTKVVNQCSKDDVSSTRPEPNPSDDVAAPWRFDVGTVGLLNAARLGLSVEPATLGYDQGGSEPSTVGVAEFARNDLEVVARYHALKIKHDALVDWVNNLKAKNLGLCVASEPLYSVDLEDP